MRIERTQARVQRHQTFRQNTAALQLGPSAVSTDIGKKLVKGIRMPKLKNFLASLLTKSSKTSAATTAEKIAPDALKQTIKPLFTKDSYIEGLIQKGKKEGTDYKVFDLDHYKAIEETDNDAKIYRVIRFRKDTSINLIAEYNSTNQRLIGVKRYDELGNLIKQ